MELDTIRNALGRTLRQPRTLADFDRGRRRNDALAPFAEPVDVVRFLNADDMTSCSQRSAVTAAVIAEAQRRGESCWAALLMAAYFPGLLRIRATVRPSAYLEVDELDALILSSFMEVVGTLPLDTQGKRAVVNLVLGTRKRVRKELKRDQKRVLLERPLNDWEEALHGRPYPSPEQLALELEAEELLLPKHLEGWLRDLAGDRGSEDDLLLVLGTWASGKPLIEWLRERRPGIDGSALVREYGRLRKRRARLLEQLRRRLEARSMVHERSRVELLLGVLNKGGSEVLQ